MFPNAGLAAYMAAEKQRKRRRSSAWTPTLLFSGQVGDWWSAEDLSSLFTDKAGTTNVAANNDVVGRWRGQVNSNILWQDTDTTSMKPLYKSALQTVQTDGVDDFLISSAALTITASPMSIMAVFDKSVLTTVNGAVSYSNNTAEYRAVGLHSTGASAAMTDRAATSTVSTPSLTRPSGTGLAAVFGIFNTAAAGGNRFFFVSGTEGTIASPPAHTLTGSVHVGRLRTGLNYSAVGLQHVVIVDKAFSSEDITNLNTFFGLS